MYNKNKTPLNIVGWLEQLFSLAGQRHWAESSPTLVAYSVWLLKVDSHHHSQCYLTQHSGQECASCVDPVLTKDKWDLMAEASKTRFVHYSLTKPGDGMIISALTDSPVLKSL